MPRKLLIQTDHFPYHITNRANNKEFFYLPLAELWPVFIDVLKELKDVYKCEIHSFVLMSNHYHLLLNTPRANLSEAMLFLHREVARHANKKSHRINHFFGGRYKWCLIQDETYFWNTMKYIFRNPVQAFICERVEDYPFSSLNKNKEFWSQRDFFGDREKDVALDLDWLNHSFTDEEKEGIRKALRRRMFKCPIEKNKKRVELQRMPKQLFTLQPKTDF